MTPTQILLVATLPEMFDASLVGRAARPALEYERTDGSRATLTFGEVDARAARMASVLRARGVRQGDRCVVHLANAPEFIDLFLACLRLGALFVPVNVLSRGKEPGHIVSDAEPALIVTSAAHRELFDVDAPVVHVEEMNFTAEHAEHAEHADTANDNYKHSGERQRRASVVVVPPFCGSCSCS